MNFFKDLREIVGKMERKRAVAKCCPKCGSSGLCLSSNFDIWLTPGQYVCKKCGYKGPIVLELCEE